MFKYILSLGLALSALTGSVAEALIVPVLDPVPTTATSPEGAVVGEFQGMITSIGFKYVTINDRMFRLNGDTQITYFGDVTDLALGEMVNYSYATNIDGEVTIVTMHVYPTTPVAGSHVVLQAFVDNATGKVELSSMNDPVVEYFQPYTFITGVSTQISYGTWYVNYAGYVNPVTGHILATEGYMSQTPGYVPFPPDQPMLTVDAPADVTPPTITLLGQSVVDMTAGDAFIDGGVTAVDNVDGDITSLVTIVGVVDTTTPGVYTLVYSVNDGAGNTATASRVVNVLAPTPALVSGSGVVTSVGRDFLVINGGMVASDHVYYTPTPVGTTFLGGITTFSTGAYVTFSGTLDGIGAVHAVEMTVTPAITTRTILSRGQVGVPYTPVSMVLSGVAPYAVTASGLPAGMSIDASGVLSGTPITSGTSTIALFVEDSTLRVMTGSAVLVIEASPTMTPEQPVVVSTGVKAEGKGIIQSYDSVNRVVVLKKGLVLRLTDVTKIKLNYRTLGSIGASVSYRGTKNTDGSVTVTQIEVK